MCATSHEILVKYNLNNYIMYLLYSKFYFTYCVQLNYTVRYY